MKAGETGYAYYLAMVLPLLTAGCVYLIYYNSFTEDAFISEEVSVTSTYYVLFIGGIQGTLSSIISLYHLIRSKKIWIVLIRVIILFPFLLMTCVILYGFLVLQNLV